jgi:hypothetical protein
MGQESRVMPCMADWHAGGGHAGGPQAQGAHIVPEDVLAGAAAHAGRGALGRRHRKRRAAEEVDRERGAGVADVGEAERGRRVLRQRVQQAARGAGRRGVRVRAARRAAAQRAPVHTAVPAGGTALPKASRRARLRPLRRPAGCLLQAARARPAPRPLAPPHPIVTRSRLFRSPHHGRMGRTCLRSRPPRRRSACGTPPRASPGGC